MSSKWRSNKDLCRCCHSEGNFRSLGNSYEHHGYEEVYCEMIREHLDITIPPLLDENGVHSFSICDVCVGRLRDAVQFRRQVMNCEREIELQYNALLKVKAETAYEGSCGEERLDEGHYIEETTELKEAINKNEIDNEHSSNTKNYLCDVCCKQFKHKSSLVEHIITHKDTNKFKCNVCDRLYTRKVGLKKHMETHSGTEKFLCDICGKRFTRKADLRRHLYTHFGIKQYFCNLCRLSFAQISHLNRHILAHKGAKQYSCDICCNKFTQKSHLNQHMLIHSGVKMFSCNICSREFTFKSSLTRHMLSHSKGRIDSSGFLKRNIETGDLDQRRHTKRYACDICHKKYTHRVYYNEHMSLHSSEKKIIYSRHIPNKRNCPEGFTNVPVKLNVKIIDRQIN